MKKILFFMILIILVFLCENKINAYQIDNGSYYIKSSIDENYAIDLYQSNIKNGTNIQMFTLNDGVNQLWYLNRESDGYYTLRSKINTNKVFDVPHSSKIAGTNVELFDINYGSNQKWEILSLGNNYYSFVSKCNGLYLTVSASDIKNETNIIVDEKRDDDTQKFKLDNIYKKTIEDGDYFISSAVNSNKVLDIYDNRYKNGTNIELFEKNGGWNQIWKVEYLNNGYYKIASAKYPQYVLDVTGLSSKPETNVELFDYNGGNNQQWAIEDLGNGKYRIISKLGNVVLDIYGGRISNGANVQIFSPNSGINQQFSFQKVSKPGKTIEDGNYVISSSKNEKKVLDIYDNKFKNKTNVEIFERNDNWNQIWHIEYLNNGYYKISNLLESNYVLEVTGLSNKPETNVEIFEYNGGDNQQWAIDDLGDGNYTIVSKLGSIVLDIYGGRISNGANVQIYSPNNGINQQFKFHKTDASPLKDGLYKIGNQLNSNNILSIEHNYLNNNSNIIMSNDINSNGQKWYVKYMKNGYYSISSGFNDEYYIDVGSGKYSSSSNVQLYKNSVLDNKLWYIKYFDGYYIIYAKKTDNSITISDEDSESDYSNNVVVDENQNNENQKFNFESTELNEEEIPEYEIGYLDDGYYTITSSLNDSFTFDAYGALKFNETNVEIFSLNNTLNQIWYVKNLEDGYYSITSAMNPALSLDVANNDSIPGTNIQIYKKDYSDGQQWVLKDTGDGYYTIVSKLGNYAIDLDSVNIDNGTNILLNDITYSNTQRFKFNLYTNEKIYKGIDVSSHNGTINWQEVSKNIDFAIIRFGYGGGEDGGDDAKFLENVRACEQYNIPYGVYLYSYALNSDIDTTVEIEHAKNSLSGISPNLGTKVFFDMEDADNWKRRHGIYDDNVLLNTITDKFCAGVESYGYSCGIYANVDWLTNKLDANSLANKYTIWVAIWPDNSTINNFSIAYNMRPAYNLTSYNYWQFTSNGSISGINGAVDLNLGYNIFD